MVKLAVLRLGQGGFAQGFAVTLAIAEEGFPPYTEVAGLLAAAPDLLETYHRWKAAYWALGHVARLGAPQQQVTNVSTAHPWQTCSTLADQLRLRLKDWYSSEQSGFKPIRETLLQELDWAEEVRLLLQTDDPQLRSLPWHLFFEPFLERYHRAELALSPQNYNRIQPASTSREKVKILAIFGCSTGLELDSDRRQLYQLPNAEVQFLVEPPRHKLNDHLWEQGWDILFFAGHSSSQPEIGQGHLQINARDTISLEQVKYALRKSIQNGLKLAIFNSCDGLELARNLVNLHLPQLIVMREPIPDVVAQAFLKHFLLAFSSGESLYLSVRQAREKLQPLEKEFPCATWLPVICQHPAFVPLTWQSFQRPKAETFFRPPAKSIPIDLPVDELVMVKRVRNTTVRVQYCDITQLEADVIVSSDDIHLTMGGGVSEAILLAAGEVAWEEARRRVPLKLGEIAITTAGHLKARQLFHAAVLDYQQQTQTTVDLIRSVTRKCLEICHAQGFQSIALPALATGTAGLSPEQSAIAMMLEILPHLNQETSLRRVTIALYSRQGLPHHILTRFYLQVSDFLDNYSRIGIMKDLLIELETIYQGQRLEAAAAIALNYREQLDVLQEQWIHELLQDQDVSEREAAQPVQRVQQLFKVMQNLSTHSPELLKVMQNLPARTPELFKMIQNLPPEKITTILQWIQKERS